LLLSIASIGMLGWDCVEFARRYAAHRTRRLACRRAREDAATIEAQITALVAEIERRTRG